MDKKNPVYGLSQQTLMDMFDAYGKALRNMNFISAAVAVATTTTKAKTVTASITFNINGVPKAKAATDNLWTLAGTITQSASAIQEAVYLFCLDASGTASVVMGDVATGSGAALVPAPTASTAAIGYVRVAIAAGTGSDFVGGTTALTTTGAYTVTFVDLIGPVVPLFSATV